ncbi:MAG: hypothetical protein P4M15_06805 [Alphaproteobacteria bacterium]|nr:hypothetical protein [Alphaproteobacteria bacterium]
MYIGEIVPFEPELADSGASWGITEEAAARILHAIQISHIEKPATPFFRISPYDKNPFAWLANPYLTKSLVFIDTLLGDSTRRFGDNIPEESHVIWVAHRTFNLPIVRRALAAADIAPDLAAFVALHHDTLEMIYHNYDTARDLATYRDRRDPATIAPFDQEAALQEILALWPEKKDHPVIRAVINDYMTDAPGLSGDIRVNAQKDKPVYSTNRDLTAMQKVAVRTLNVAIRSSDKLHSAASDVWQRELFLLWQRETSVKSQFQEAAGQTQASMIPLAEQRRHGLPDADVANAAHQIRIKGYAMEYGDVPRKDRENYKALEKYMVAQACEVARNDNTAPQPEASPYSWLTAACTPGA